MFLYKYMLSSWWFQIFSKKNYLGKRIQFDEYLRERKEVMHEEKKCERKARKAHRVALKKKGLWCEL